MATGVSLIVNLNRIINVFALSFALWRIVAMPMPSSHPNGQFAGQAKFFTVWNLVIQIVFYSSCLWKEAFSKVKFDSRKSTKRGLLYHAVVFPASIIVVATFWGLYHIDRNLIFPKHMEPFLPPLINHIIHTLVLPSVLFEGLFYSHPRPSAKNGLTAFFTVAVTYVVWVVYIGLFKDYWVYPFLAIMSLKIKFVFFMVVGLIGVLLYKLGGFYHKVVWGKKGAAKVKAKAS